jgi:hypothetical protein
MSKLVLITLIVSALVILLTIMFYYYLKLKDRITKMDNERLIKSSSPKLKKPKKSKKKEVKRI